MKISGLVLEMEACLCKTFFLPSPIVLISPSLHPSARKLRLRAHTRTLSFAVRPLVRPHSFLPVSHFYPHFLLPLKTLQTKHHTVVAYAFSAARSQKTPIAWRLRCLLAHLSQRAGTLVLSGKLAAATCGNWRSWRSSSTPLGVKVHVHSQQISPKLS